MSHTKLIWSMFGFVCGTLFAASALADVTIPPRDLPPGKNDVPLIVKYDANKDVSFLRISRLIVDALAEPPVENKKTGWTPSEPRSIFAALALSAGIAGAFFVCGRKRTAFAAVVLVAGTVVVMSAVQSFANFGPPRKPQSIQVPAEFHGGVVVDISDRNDFVGVELIIGTKKPPENNRARPPLPPKSEEKKT